MVIYRSLGAAILIAGSLLAQSQSQASPKAVQQNAASTAPTRPTSGGATSAKSPMPARDVPDTREVVLPGCGTSPSSRLIGRWASIDPLTAAISCHYFGPIDKHTGTGVYVTYRLEALDKKTGARSPILPGTGEPPQTVSWDRVERGYRVLMEDPRGNWVRLDVGLTSDTPTWETHTVSCHSTSDFRSSPTVETYRYVDNSDLACSDGDGRWKDNFSRFLAVPPPAAPVYPRTGHEVRYQVDGDGRASLTYRNPSGGTDQMTVKLPWTLTFTGQPKQFVYLSAQNTEEFGKIESTIYLDDVPVQKAVSNSPYGIATVSGTIPSVR